MRFTQHNLTNAQLRRLSQIANNRAHNYGNALAALERKGLVEEKCGPGITYQRSHAVTSLGKSALEQARREGW